MYLNRYQINDIIAKGEMLNTEPDLVNPASLDVRLGSTILVERYNETQRPLEYSKRERMSLQQIEIPDEGFVLMPGAVMLAHTMEQCNFADNTAALFRIKSSMGRVFLEHMDAGWVDPGFHGSLTLEFKNLSNYHPIRLRTGDRIGQLIFFKGEEVMPEHSYRSVGNYAGSDSVVQIQYKE